MSEFENILPSNEEVESPTTKYDKTAIVELIKKYRKIFYIIVAIIAIAIVAVSVFNSPAKGENSLFVDNMLVFNEINVENHMKMYGVIDKNGEIITDADFSLAYLVGDGMIVAQEPPAGDSAHVSGLASMGLIDQNGKEITKFSYSDSGIEFTQDMLPMAENDKWGFADKKGNWVIKPKFGKAHSFAEGLAGARDAKSLKWGFADTNGKWAIKAEYEDVGSFKDGIAPAKLDGKWGFIDNDGNWAIKNTYIDVDVFHEELALARDVNENWGFIDKDGNWVIKPRFQELGLFCEDVAAAKKNGKWGFIDKKGKWVIDNEYADAGNFAGGLAYAKESPDGKYGYINKRGKWKIKPKYDMAYDFSMGLACVKDGGKYGYINKKGKTKIDFEYKYALSFYDDGFAPVCTGDKKTSENDEWFVIDKKGKAIFEDTFDGLMR